MGSKCDLHINYAGKYGITRVYVQQMLRRNAVEELHNTLYCMYMC